MNIQHSKLDEILDFIRFNIYRIEGDFGSFDDIVVCIPKYIIRLLSMHHPSHSPYTYIDTDKMTIFGKKVQSNYNNSVVVFKEEDYDLKPIKATLEL